MRLQKNFLLGEEERANFAIADYIQRTTLLENEKQETKGILIEWEEVPVGDECSRTLLRLQTMKNLTQAAEEEKLTQWETHRRERFPTTGADENREFFCQLKMG